MQPVTGRRILQCVDSGKHVRCMRVHLQETVFKNSSSNLDVGRQRRSKSSSQQRADVMTSSNCDASGDASGDASCEQTSAVSPWHVTMLNGNTSTANCAGHFVHNKQTRSTTAFPLTTEL